MELSLINQYIHNISRIYDKKKKKLLHYKIFALTN